MELEEINNEFLPHKESLLLKQIGFNKPCLFVYSEKGERSPFRNFFVCNSNVPSYATGPTYRQAFKWFRENYDVICHIHKPRGPGYTVEHYFDIWPKDMEDYKKWNGRDTMIPTDYCNSYEEAELACINKLIEIITLQQKNETESSKS